jgi:uncharacterized protein (DUF2249 family)
VTDLSPATPVKRNDRVSDVLARDETLVEVFVRQAPHFAKLRNRAMRSVMARLVTVEQAARTANVSPDALVRELNAALGFSDAVREVGPLSSVDTPSTQLEHPARARVVELDVRDDLRQGREPFSRIMAAVSALDNDDVLHLRAIFEPAPLFAVLAKRGYQHESRAHADDDWSVWFWRSNAPPPAAEPPSSAVDDEELPAVGATTVRLDVRGLTPPEPLTRTLAALESMPAGHTLIQINSRVPRFLLPMLVERGFTWEIDETRPDRVFVHIRHV